MTKELKKEIFNEMSENFVQLLKSIESGENIKESFDKTYGFFLRAHRLDNAFDKLEEITEELEELELFKKILNQRIKDVQDRFKKELSSTECLIELL